MQRNVTTLALVIIITISMSAVPLLSSFFIGTARAEELDNVLPTTSTTNTNTTLSKAPIPFPPQAKIRSDIARMFAASANAVVVPAGSQKCLVNLDRFILPLKEHRFIVIRHCVTVTGRVIWTHYFNDDGDANFNVQLDPPFAAMLAQGNYNPSYLSKAYVKEQKAGIAPGIAGIHVEAVCQGPVTSNLTENVGACNGYSGPRFVLPKLGEHVSVTGRYLIEYPEVQGGLAELHPAYDIHQVH
jgi:hypothetical protein